jgi:UDP-N-acetylmuramate--alanine ligase
MIVLIYSKDFFVENTVIITPAVPSTHSEWNYFMEREYNIKKRAEVLGIITKILCFAVAGTHGKTTSSILGHIYMKVEQMTVYRRYSRKL